MWRIFIIVCLAQIVSAQEPSCRCGVPSDSLVTMRIVGGRRAVPHAFPWTVAVVKNVRHMHCGGALITNKHVVSAGHCFKWNAIDNLLVLIGLDDLNDPEGIEKRAISDVIIHENFSSTSVRDVNDIAVVTMSKPVEFSDKIVPICFPSPKQDFTHRTGTIAGWGRVGPHKLTSNVLMKATVQILSDTECVASKLSDHIVLSAMMCAYSKGRDGCQGDSGGPLITYETSGYYVLAGIVSWGIGCADPRFPGVYTKVASYVDWIKEHSADGKTCPKMHF